MSTLSGLRLQVTRLSEAMMEATMRCSPSVAVGVKNLDKFANYPRYIRFAQSCSKPMALRAWNIVAGKDVVVIDTPTHSANRLVQTRRRQGAIAELDGGAKRNQQTSLTV